MKAYVAVTVSLYGVLGVLYLFRLVIDWKELGAAAWPVAVTTVIAFGLAVWGWKLLAEMRRGQ
ncbi:MAG TPA: hypothetical protein VKS60_20175 [Stellaceae bacterium]|nr:hypothetical protein [Stellaceae bacterium]